MFFRFFPFIATIFFVELIFFVLYFFANLLDWWWIILLNIFIIFIFTKKAVGKFSNTLLPLLLVLASLPVLSLMGTPSLRYFAIILLSLLFYLALLVKGRLNDNPANKIALSILSGVNFSIFFVLSNLLFASFINFSEQVFPDWLMIVLSALICFIVSRDTLVHSLFLSIKRNEITKNDINISSLIIALMTSEIAWGLLFFPFRYRSSATILFATYYLFFTTTQFFLTKEEKNRRLAKDVVVVLIAIGIILITSKWRYY